MYVERAKLGVILCPGDQTSNISVANLRGYGNKMVRLSFPISIESSYKEFREEMKRNEDEYIVELKHLREQNITDV